MTLHGTINDSIDTVSDTFELLKSIFSCECNLRSPESKIEKSQAINTNLC